MDDLEDLNTNNENLESNLNLDDNDAYTLPSGETILDKPLLNSFFDTERLILFIEKTWKGYSIINNEWVYTSRPIARTAFINKTVNILRSVMNPQNFNSKLSDKQIDQILLEKNMEFIDLIRNEPDWSLADEDIESTINMFDHALETFFGIVQNGRISEMLVQVATGTYDSGTYKKENHEEKKSSIFSKLNPFNNN